MQCGDQREIRLARIIHGRFGRHWQFKPGQPCGAALLDRLDADAAPFLDLGRCPGVVPIRHGALGQHRHDPVRAEFGCFLHNKIHRLALGHGLVKRDLEGQGGMLFSWMISSVVESLRASAAWQSSSFPAPFSTTTRSPSRRRSTERACLDSVGERRSGLLWHSSGGMKNRCMKVGVTS